MRIPKLIRYNPVTITGKQLNSTCKLPLNVLESSGNYLVHKSILRHETLKHQGTVSTKTKSEVRGGGRKPWKQKGTGRARVGSNRSPLWKGGGVIFGPKFRTKTYKLNKKERQLALQTLLYNKKHKILIVDDLEKNFKIPKTKEFYKICNSCNINLDQKILLIVSKKLKSLKFSSRNLSNVELLSSSSLNSLSLIKANHIIFTPLAINEIKEIFCE